MNKEHTFRLAHWTVIPSRNLLETDRGEQRKLEPLTMNLLVVLHQAGGDVVSRDALVAALWPDTIVADDTLARVVSRLRHALGDDKSAPEFIETIPKRGYRLLPNEARAAPTTQKRAYLSWAVIIILVAVVFSVLVFPDSKSPDFTDTAIIDKGASTISETLVQAERLYMRFTRVDNESALALYEKVLSQEPQNQQALAGMSNALVQRLIRWPQGVAVDEPSIQKAIASDQLASEQAVNALQRAQLLAERAVRISPNDVKALKSLGFVYSAQNKLDDAREVYLKAIDLDPHEWRSLINLGEIYTIRNQTRQAVTTLIKAHSAMQANYDAEPENIGPWLTALEVVIAEKWLSLADLTQAEQWFRLVLDRAPLQPQATAGLVKILLESERIEEARERCLSYENRLTALEVCERS